MITHIISKLPFIDKQGTVAFYTNLLGFSLRSDYGDYLIMDLQATELHFFSYPAMQPSKSDFMIYLRLNNGIDEFYKSLSEKGISIHPNGPLEDKAWGQREFSIIDPNGTLLTFGQGI